MSEPRKQHYTPQLLLRGFAVERKPDKFQTIVYDKQSDRTFPSAVEDVAAERDFNTLEVGEYVLSWEKRLEDIESMAGPVINRIRNDRSLQGLTNDDKAALAIFAATQFVRGKDHRVRYAELCKAMAQRAAEILGDRPLPPELVDAGNDHDVRRASLDVLENRLEEFTQHFASKQLMLFVAPAGSSFIIGDSPITLHNQRTFGPYGNLGLAVRGIQIYLPLSTELTLGFWCRSHRVEYENAIRQAERDLASSNGFALLRREEDRRVILDARTRVESAIQTMRQRVRDLDCGRPEIFEYDHFEHVNSLQIANAERFVMSKGGDFALVKRMIGDNEKFRTGKRMTLG